MLQKCIRMDDISISNVKFYFNILICFLCCLCLERRFMAKKIDPFNYNFMEEDIEPRKIVFKVQISRLGF